MKSIVRIENAHRSRNGTLIYCPPHDRSSQDINQSLVDDGLVDMDKIGASNFFWSFPSKVVVTRRNLVESLKRDIAKVRGRIESEVLPDII